MRDKSLYSDGQLYDLVMGRYAPGDVLDFYRRQISRYGHPVLELACGTGRLTIPLAEGGVEIVGLDISPQMLEVAEGKALECGAPVTLVRGDVRTFNLGRRFRLIFIPAQSLSHLHKREEIEACLTRVRQHLAPGGRFLVEVFNPSVKLLAREPGQRYRVGPGEYEAAGGVGRIIVTAQARYDAATQVSHVRYFYRREGGPEESTLSFEMRQFFPQEMDALLVYNGFRVEAKYGDYNEAALGSDSPKQLIVCQAS